jgi:NAD-dependent deacetylase
VNDIDRARSMLAGPRLVTFSGAGLSAESGVSTFRDAATDGAWTKHDPMRLASPAGFAEDPDLVLAWYADRRRRIAAAAPNAAHRALAGRPDALHVTQNVDDLLARAGARDVVQLHGDISREVCHARCGHEISIDLASPPPRQSCPRCGAPMRPGVVWFGEALPPEAWGRAEKACTSCDALIVIGTSAVVYPAAGLIGLARASGARVIVVNTESSAASDLADVELLGPAGEVVPALLE